MRRSKKAERVSRLQAENADAQVLADQSGLPEAQLAVMNYIRQGEILQQLQEIQANSWTR